MTEFLGMDLGGKDASGYVRAKQLPDGTLLIVECGRIYHRIVRSAKRKRKLIRRGEAIMWDTQIRAWTWNLAVPETEGVKP